MSMIIDDLMAKIEEAKAAEDAQIIATEDAKDAFRVRDLKSATWAMDRYRELEAKETEINLIAQAELQKYTDMIISWQNKETEQISAQKEYFKFLLTDYYMEQKQLNPKFKLSTPYGSMSQRTLSKWTYDDQILLPYLRENAPELIRVKEELDKSAIKARFANGVDLETGEVIEGISITEETTYSIKTKEPEA